MKLQNRIANRLRYLQAWALYYKQRLGARVDSLRSFFAEPDQRNAWHLYGDIGWWGISNGIIGTFTGVFAIRLGASDALVGLLASLPALINIVWLVPAGRIVERSTDVKRSTVVGLLLQRLVYLLIALMPFLLLTRRAEAIVALVTAGAIPGALAGIAFTALLARSVSASNRGSVVSIRSTLLAITSMLSVLAAGQILDRILFPYNYQIVFGIAFAASLLSLWQVNKVVLRQPEPSAPADADAAAADTGNATVEQAPKGKGLRGAWQEIKSEKAFLRFAGGSFCLNWGMYFPMALYGLYRVNELGATDSWLGLLSTVMSAVQAVMFIVWGRAMKRVGSRRVFLIGVFGLAGFPLFTGLSTSVWPLLLVAIWGAFFSSGYSIAHFDALMSACPPDRLPTYTATYNTLINITAFVAPLIGTAVSGWIGIRYALILGGALRLLGAIIMSRIDFGSPPDPSAGPGLRDRLRSYLAYRRQRRALRRAAQ